VRAGLTLYGSVVIVLLTGILLTRFGFFEGIEVVAVKGLLLTVRKQANT